MGRTENNQGFTLIEMMAAMTIIAAIMSMVYAGYAATTRSMEASQRRGVCVERAAFALRLMARQIRCAYAPVPRASTANQDMPDANPDAPTSNLRTAASPDEGSARFRGDSRDPRGEILSFVTGHGPGIDPNAHGLAYLTYLFDRASSTLSIRRQDRPGQPRSPASAPDSCSVLRNVTDIQLGFYSGRSWEQTWDLGSRSGLPRAVKIELTVTDEAGQAHHLETTVPILQQTYPESAGPRRTFAAQP